MKDFLKRLALSSSLTALVISATVGPSHANGSLKALDLFEKESDLPTELTKSISKTKDSESYFSKTSLNLKKKGQSPTPLKKKDSSEAKYVLSLDGGGIRGIGTLVMLSMLEMKTGKRANEMFDLIVGTSTGGISALLLSEGRTATEVLNLYFDKGNQIFQRSWWNALTNPMGLAGPLYSVDGINAVIQETVGKSRLGDAKLPVAVTTMNVNTGKTVLLSSHEAKTNPESVSNITLGKAARATSAAPTYFEGQMLRVAHPEKAGGKEKAPKNLFVDGGVSANHPGSLALAHAKEIFGEGADIHMVSLGTGVSNPLQISARAGILGFGAPSNIPGFFMNNTSNMTDEFLRTYLHDKYHRFQFNLAKDIDLADTSQASKDALMKLGFETSLDPKFNKLVAELRGFEAPL